MNKELQTYDGGQPVYARDLSFMQEALAETTAMLSKAFGDTYILYGTVDESRENITAGAVCIAGQIYEVPESLAGVLGTKKLCYRAVDTDERTFYDGQNHKVYRSYQAYLSDSTDGAVAFIDLKTAPVLGTSLIDLLLNSEPTWKESVFRFADGVDGKVNVSQEGKLSKRIFVDLYIEYEKVINGRIFTYTADTFLKKDLFGIVMAHNYTSVQNVPAIIWLHKEGYAEVYINGELQQTGIYLVHGDFLAMGTDLLEA